MNNESNVEQIEAEIVSLVTSLAPRVFEEKGFADFMRLIRDTNAAYEAGGSGVRTPDLIRYNCASLALFALKGLKQNMDYKGD